MAQQNSPNIVTSGLVFAYDMNSPRSYAGQPTTNLVGSAASMSGWNSYSNGNDGTFTTEFGTTGYRMNARGSWNGISKGITIPSTGTYTFSAYFRYWGGSSNNNGAQVYVSGWGGGDTASGLDKTKIGVWQRVSLTLSVTTASCTFYIISYGGTSGADNSTWEVTMPQVESGSYATAFATGTRSNTQALIDLTGTNTTTANSLTYASDGTFSFNGSSNSITIPFNSSQFTFNSAQTIIIWMKNQSPSTARRNPYNQAYAGGGTITHESDTNFNYYFGTGGSDNSPYTGFTSSFSVVVGETAMICLTRDASTVSWYKNGAFSNSISNPYGSSVVTGTNNITIGSGYAGSFGGNIYAVQLYNRALSASEVKQNFNALRGRYGI